MDPQFKYEQIFKHIVSAVEGGVLLPGDRLDSLRKTAARYHCSVSVVMQAYELLECRGYIRSREKSGYFIEHRGDKNIPEPHKSRHSLKPAETRSCALINQILEMSSDPDYIPLAAAIPDSSILASKKITTSFIRNMKNSPDYLSRYSGGAGSSFLRHELVKYMHGRSVTTEAEDIIITNGCSEALYHAVLNCTGEGDTVAIETPVFTTLITILENLGRKVVEVPTSPDTGLDLDIVAQLLKEKQIDAVAFSSCFQNPLSFIMPDTHKRRLYALAEEYDIPLIEDDIFADCSFKGEPHFPVKALDVSGRVLYCSSFSKTLVPGMRLGWIMPGRWKERVLQSKLNCGLGGALFIQESVAEFLREGHYDYHLKSFRKKIAEQTYTLRELLKRTLPEGCRISWPGGGFFLWIELEEHVDTRILYSRALEKKIGIVPGTVFSASGGFKNCFRVSCGTPVDSAIREAVVVLGDLVKEILEDTRA